MEAAEELEPSGVLDKILPLQLEDSILRAATAAKSRATSILTGEESRECVNDPWLDPAADALTGVEPEHDLPGGPCAGEKGGKVEACGDDVVVPGESDAADEMAVGAGADVGEGHAACVDGLQGVEDGVKGGDRIGGNAEEAGWDDDDKEEPILVEGVV
ncbi:uncharacterized protein LOC116201352 [Punica granatum]|uniref:Uncharacterized protein n=2 Tax=Punica granatum TaxID=22663 RepID=A0A218WUN1_PUNGR|nr:uncharacterized protein LOC116201352 [Punica granatum]OWM76485.1 hypothetical protein CDL15_Pgr005449 [Punica granatum]PKI71039.1 hypothetical protein CRG98_008620 [Punica granatum]